MREAPLALNIRQFINVLHSKEVRALICRALRDRLIRGKTTKTLDGGKPDKDNRCEKQRSRENETHIGGNLGDIEGRSACRVTDLRDVNAV